MERFFFFFFFFLFCFLKITFPKVTTDKWQGWVLSSGSVAPESEFLATYYASPETLVIRVEGPGPEPRPPATLRAQETEAVV